MGIEESVKFAGEMANPTAGISVEEPRRAVSKARAAQVAEGVTSYSFGGETGGSVPAGAAESGSVPAGSAAGASLPPLDTDANARRYAATDDGVLVSDVYPSDAGLVKVRRNRAHAIQMWRKNPQNEFSALFAGMALYETLNPGASIGDCLSAMKGQVFGAGTDNPTVFAGRLFDILGGDSDALDFADKAERGELSEAEAKSALSASERSASERLGGTEASRRADAFRQRLLDGEAVADWRRLRLDGYSVSEARAVMSLVPALGAMTASEAADWLSAQFKNFGIERAARKSAVVRAISERLPERSGFWRRFEEQTGDYFLRGRAERANAETLHMLSSMREKFSVVLREGKFDKEALGAFGLMRRGEFDGLTGMEIRNADTDFARSVWEEAKKRGMKWDGDVRKGIDEESNAILAGVLKERLSDTADEAESKAAVLTNFARKYSEQGAVSDFVADNFGGAAENISWLLGSVLTGGALIPFQTARYYDMTSSQVPNAAVSEGAELDRALLAGEIAGGVEAGLEILPVWRLLGLAGSAKRFFAGTAAQKAAKSLSSATNDELAQLFLPSSKLSKAVRELGGLGKTVATEWGTEVAQNMATSGATQWAVDGDWWSGAKQGLDESVSGKSGTDLAGTILAVSVAGHGAAKGVSYSRHISAVRAYAEEAGIDPKHKAEAEAAYNAMLKRQYAFATTLRTLGAIDAASDGRALGADGKVSGDMTAFVHRVMLPGVGEDGKATAAYSRHWDAARKAEFLKDKNGGKAVPSAMTKAFDLLDATQEVAAERVKEAQKFAEAAKKRVQAAMDAEFGPGTAEETEGTRRTEEADSEGAESGSASPLSADHLAELTKRFLAEGREMGDADISAELRAAFCGETGTQVDAATVDALKGMAGRCTSAFEFLSVLDAYADSCAKDLKTRTTAQTKAARVTYYGLQHAGVLANPTGGYANVIRFAYSGGIAARTRAAALTEAQKSRMGKMFARAFPGVEVQFGGVPEWASAESRRAIEDGVVNGLYAPGKIWISESAFVGTGLHEAVWHGTWAACRAAAEAYSAGGEASADKSMKRMAELYRQMKEYARRAPGWLKDEIARGYADKADVDYEEVCEEIGAFLFENEFEGDFLRDLDSATRTWWNGLKGKFKEAFGAVVETEGADAHDAVRELMKAFEEGRGVKSEESGNTSGGFSGENGRGSKYSSGNGMGTRSAFSEGERWSAPPPIQWTGGVPESEKSLSETVAGIERNNSVKVSGTISENLRNSVKIWKREDTSKARRALASAILSEVENPRATLSDGRRFELTSKGLSEALNHATKLREGRFLDAAVELMKNAATFMEGAEEFYRETKNGETHCNFGGVVTFGGTEYYTVFTCVERPEGLRLKSVNSFKKETGTPPRFQAATPKRASRTMGGVPDVGDALRWIVKNQDKSVEDFNSWRDGNRALLEEAEARKRQSERQSRVRPGKGFHVSAADFAKFDSSFMGTGEGAQAYGWGTYFLTRPSVWRNYRRSFTKWAFKLKDESRRAEYEALKKKVADAKEEFERLNSEYNKALKEHVDEARNASAVADSVAKEIFKSNENHEREGVELEASFSGIARDIAYHTEPKYDVEKLVERFNKSPLAGDPGVKEAIEKFKAAIRPLSEAYQKQKEVALNRISAEFKVDRARRELSRFEIEDGEKYKVRPYTYRAEFDETKKNMLNWTKPLTSKQFERFIAALRKRRPDTAKKFEDFKGRLSKLHELADKLGGTAPRDVSLALDDAGFIGHKMPVGGARTDDYRHGHNYVIYNADERVRITGKVRWSKAMENSFNALSSLAAGEAFGVLHNAKYGEIRYPLGKLGKGGFGFLHIVEQRIRKDGATLDDAIDVALRVGVSAEIGEETAARYNTRHLDFDGVRAIVAVDKDEKPIITGYAIGKTGAEESDGAHRRSFESAIGTPHVSSEAIVAALKEKLAQMRSEVNPERIAAERQSRSYRAADTHEQEYQRAADAAILAVYKLVGGAVSEKCKWLRTLPEWEQVAVVNRSEILCKFARLRLGTKGPVSISDACRAVLSASSFDIDRLKNAIVFDSVTNGVYVERRARAKLSDELASMEAQGAKEGRGLALSTDLSDEAVRLGEALTGSQGAGAAIRGSAQTLTERAGALRPLLRDAAKRFELEEGASESAVVEALAAAAERASLPAEHVAKLRAAGNALGSEEFEADTDAGKMKRAAAADIVAETLSALGVSEEMLSSGMASVKDRAVEKRAEQEAADADTAEESARRAFEGEDPSALAARAAASVLRGAWAKVSRALGVSGLEVETFVGGDVSPAGLLSLIEAQARARAEALEAEADACTRKMAAGALSLEERRKLNGKRNGLRSDAGKVRAAASPGGALCAAFKADAEALAKRMLQRGGGAATVNATVALRAAFSTRDAIGAACSLLLTAGNKEAAASLPYLRGRLRGLLFSMPKLDERTDDASSYYTAEWRVLANQLREVGSVWWDKSFEEVQAEIDRLEGAEASDDHMRARIRALQLVGGAKNMSAPMLDKAFWEILSERDTSFLEQRQDVRARRRETEQEAADFLKAAALNPHAKPLDKSMAQDAAEQATSQGGLSFGDRLRGWVKHAKGELREKALSWIDGIEKRLSDAASMHDALEVEQNDWAVRTMRGIFGAGWKARVSRLCTVALPELAKFENTSNALAKQGDVSPMRALHIYMSARQKSFGAALLTPGAFSEESRGALETRRKYVEQARDGGELETFLKRFEGGVLWKLKEAYAARWKELFPRLNAAYRGVFGFDLYDPFGETDYYPLKLKSGEDSAGRGKVARSGAVMLPVARRFRSRTVNVAELETNRTFLEVATEQIEDTLHTIAYAEAHSQMEAFVGNAKIAETLAARVSGTDLNGFRDHLADIFAMPSQRPEGNRAGRVVNALTAVIALGGNVLTPIRQATGGGTYAAESPFGAGATTAAMLYPLWGTLWGGQYLADAARVWRDPLFRARYEETSRLLDQAALRGKAGHGAKGAARAFFKTLKNALMWGVKAGDAVPIMTCGVGFYRLYYAQNLRRGMTEARAHDDAMRGMMALTEKTQQTRRMMNKTSWQRSSGGLTQVLTQFKSMNDQALGNEARAIADLAAGLGEGKRWRKAFRSVVAHHLLFGAFSDFVMQCVFMALSGDDDDDLSFWEKLNLWELGAAAAGGGLYGSTFAFVAFDLLGAGEQVRLVAKDMGADVPRGVPSTAWGASVVPAVSVMTNMLRRTGRAVRFGLDDDKDAEDAWREFAKAFGGGKTMLRIADRIAADSEDDGEK